MSATSQSTIRLQVFRCSRTNYVVVASRFSDGKVDIYFVTAQSVTRWQSHRAMPDIRRHYRVSAAMLTPAARAVIRAVFDKEGDSWGYDWQPSQPVSQ